MRFSSIEFFFAQALHALKRFPFAIGFALLATVVACLREHLEFFRSHWTYFPLFSKGYSYHQLVEDSQRVLMTAYLGMLLFISLSLFIQRRRRSPKLNFLLQGLGLVLLLIYCFTLPTPLDELAGIRFFLYALGLMLLVAFAPFMVRGEMNEFWHFNKALCVRILMAGLYALVLYVGLALGLSALDHLFSIKIDSHVYVDLAIIVVGLFVPWFFLSGVPNHLENLEATEAYPHGLKIFAQYLLLPLVVLYLIILYCYEIKIFIAADWPNGWVVYLVLCFSIIGISSFLLMWPLRNQEGHRWIKKFTRLFYFLILPLILMLFLAIYKRVAQYGITENRYFVILLTLWLAFLSLYFLISKRKNIKFIPISLCLLAFLSSFGPWGAFNVSKQSQLRQMERIFRKNHLLDKTNHYRPVKNLNLKDESDLSRVIQYLVQMYGHKVMQPYLHQNLDSLLSSLSSKKGDSFSKKSAQEKILNLMSLPFINKYDRADEIVLETSYVDPHENIIDVRGYDGYLYWISFYRKDQLKTYQVGKGNALTLALDANKRVLNLTFKEGGHLSLNLIEAIEQLALDQYRDRKIPKEKITFVISNKDVEVQLRFRTIRIQKRQQESQIQSIAADVLLRWK